MIFGREVVEEKIHFNSLNLIPRDVSKEMGYSSKEVPDYLNQIIDNVLNNAADHFNLRGGYIINNDINIIKSNNKIIIDNQILNVERIICSLLKNVMSVAVFVCTAGNGVTEWAQKETDKGNILLSYTIDTVGSVAVEKAMDLMQEDIKVQLGKEGLAITNRYSPGYCKWHVSEQHKLFSLLPKNFCGVSLTPSALMKPIKSISGIIGVGSQVKTFDYTCKICDMKDCFRRMSFRE